MVEPTEDQVVAVRTATQDLLDTAGVEKLVAAYFDPHEKFAADTFETLKPVEENRLTIADMLAVTFLNVTVGPLAVRRILGADADDIEYSLKRIGMDVPLWEATDEKLTAAWDLFDHLDGYDDVGEVTAGKLLARKRPALIPIVDKVAVKVLSLPPGRAWSSLRKVLQDQELRSRIDGLTPEHAPGQTTIRLLDVAAWMRGSAAGSAKAVRAQFGMPDLPYT